MTDVIGYTPGTGADVAVDNIGGAIYQRIKLALGADGVDNGDVSATNPMPVQDATAEHLLSLLLGLLDSPRGYDKSQARQRGTVVLESGTLTTLTTLTTLANIAAIGGYSAQMQVMDTNRTGWAQTVRARIT